MKKNTKETNKQITTAIGSIMYIVESAQKIPMAIQLKHLSKSLFVKVYTAPLNRLGFPQCINKVD